MFQVRTAQRFLLTITMVLALPAWGAPFKVGLVLDKGGKDDKSFNNAAFNGLDRAGKELQVTTKYVEASDDNSYEPLLRSFAKKDFDLIISVGFAQAEAVKKVAAQFPKVHFAIIDGDVSAPNVRSLMFEEHEGSYLAGALAAMHAKGNKIGFIGGMDIPLIKRFFAGYQAGAKAVNPKMTVMVNYVGITGDAWNNPTKAKELAIAQIQSGCTVLFGAAGASGAGVFDAAEEKKALAIGVDSNQNWVKPGTILTSMVKRVDVAVFKTIADAKAQQFTAGTVRYGLANDGVGLAFDNYNAKLVTAADHKTLDTMRGNIISSKIKVPTSVK